MDEHTRREIEAVVGCLHEITSAAKKNSRHHIDKNDQLVASAWDWHRRSVEDVALRLRALLPREPELEEVVEEVLDGHTADFRVSVTEANALRAALRRRRGER